TVERVAVVTRLVREALTVAAGRFTRARRAIRLDQALVTAVERQIDRTGRGVVALLGAFFHLVAANGLLTGAGSVTHVAGLELATRVATVTGSRVAVVALLDADDRLLVTAHRATRRTEHRTGVTQLELAARVAAITRSRVAVVTGFTRGVTDFAVAAELLQRAGLARCRAGVARFDLAVARATVVTRRVAVVT